MGVPACERRRRDGGVAALIVLLGLISSSTCMAFSTPSGVRQQIRAVYRKACAAARIKFLLGMVAYRAPNFKAYDADGHEIDPVAQGRFYRYLLADALSVDETARITACHQQQDGKVVCRVHDELLAVLPIPGSKKLHQLVVKTVSDDIWVRTHLGWRQTESHVLEQTSRFRPTRPTSPARSKL